MPHPGRFVFLTNAIPVKLNLLVLAGRNGGLAFEWHPGGSTKQHTSENLNVWRRSFYVIVESGAYVAKTHIGAFRREQRSPDNGNFPYTTGQPSFRGHPEKLADTVISSHERAAGKDSVLNRSYRLR